MDIEDYITVTSSWQGVNIPLEVFEDQGVDLSNLAYFQLEFEWEETAGTIYLDNIKIGSKDYDTDCEGDFDDDGDVDGSDLAVFTADFGRTDCP